jgi:hypothetical protein
VKWVIFHFFSLFYYVVISMDIHKKDNDLNLEEKCNFLIEIIFSYPFNSFFVKKILFL